MHGVPRWERIESTAGQRHAMQMTAHRAAVGPDLIKLRFEKMRQQAGGDRR
jgi:hypothetical protein